MQSDENTPALLAAEITAVKQEAEQAARLDDSTRINSDQKKQLDALNEPLAAQKELQLNIYIKDSIVSMMYKFKDNGVDKDRSVDTGRAIEAEIQKECDELKKRVKWLEEENFMLR